MALAPLPLKRLTRPSNAPGFRITARDLEILAWVARFRFLSSEQVIRLVQGSPQGVRVRLKLLFYHGLLDRPRHQHAQLAAFFDEGNWPLVYGLGKKGAKVLSALGTAIDGRLDWTAKNTRASLTFLAHTLATARVMIAIDNAAKAQGGVALVDHHDLFADFPPDRRRAGDPFRCRVEVRLPGEGVPLQIGVVPDRLFSFHYQDGTRHNFALEVDRGTMDIHAKRLAGKSSFRRKLIGYFHAWRQKAHGQAWGFQSFRVLTVTPSTKRIDSMRKAQQEVTAGAADGLFLYTTPDALERDPLGRVWLTGAGTPVSLIT